ncbi:MAG: hypothetical protein AAFX10_10055 [Pseudomonadota bacterium]
MTRATSTLALCASIALLTAACARDAAWRLPENDDGRCNVAANTDAPFIDEIGAGVASIAYVEFTERGNLHNRRCTEKVYEYLETEIGTARNGVALFVYVHGWKHDADPSDGNVADFAATLERYAKAATAAPGPASGDAFPGTVVRVNGATKPRKVIGLYVGWRGRVFKGFPFRYVENLTYWNRKTVAQEIGKGGATELLLTLRTILQCGTRGHLGECTPQPDNIYLIAGHSFGAGIVLSALNEHMLAAIEQATPAETGVGAETLAFNDALVLINPAIEANQLLQSKELIATTEFDDRQDVLMHIISSRGDRATHVAFPLGQKLRSVFWNKKVLTRLTKAHGDCPGDSGVTGEPDSMPIELRESELLSTTVGNYPPFWTGLLKHTGDDWQYQSLTGSNCPRDLEGRPVRNHIYAPRNSPIQNIYTDANFIEDHSKIFNERLLAYVAAVVSESLALPRRQAEQVAPECFSPTHRHATNRVSGDYEGLSFDFRACFAHFLSEFRR